MAAVRVVVDGCASWRGHRPMSRRVPNTFHGQNADGRWKQRKQRRTIVSAGASATISSHSSVSLGSGATTLGAGGQPTYDPRADAALQARAATEAAAGAALPDEQDDPPRSAAASGSRGISMCYPRVATVLTAGAVRHAVLPLPPAVPPAPKHVIGASAEPRGSQLAQGFSIPVC